MKSISKLVLLFVVFSSVFCVEVPEGAPEIKEEDNVLVLTEQNFDYVVTNNKHVLVEFYAPWCGHCKALAPEYAKAASTLKAEEPEVKLAKVDATFETALGSKYEVKGYPTLKFFQDGKPMEYQGGREAPDIINWLKKKTGPPCKLLNNDEEVKSFKAANEVAVIGYFASSETAEAKNYETAANQVDGISFGVIFNKEVANAAEVNLNAVVIFKQFDEGRLDYEGELSDDSALAAFVNENEMRLVSEFTPESAPKIFGGEIQTHNLLFISKLSGDFDKLYAAFKEAAAKFKGKVLFIYVDTDVEDNKRLMEFFGIADADIPDCRIVKLAEKMAKFKPESKDLTTNGFVTFTEDVQSGKIKRHLMSEEVPADWNKNPVSVLVGKNFKEVAFDQSKKVFVEFYAPWCGHCKSLKPTWEKLGEAFKDDKDVVIATMDSTTNEVTDFEISGFPTLKFFPSGSDKILDYNGDRSVEAMVEYVKSNGEKVTPPSEPLPAKEVSPPSGGQDAPKTDPSGQPSIHEDPSKIDLSKIDPSKPFNVDEEMEKFRNMDIKDFDPNLHPEKLAGKMKQDLKDSVATPNPEEVAKKKQEL